MKIIFDTLTNISNELELYEKIEEYVPNWIIGSVFDYSPDYPHLKNNWLTICNQIKVDPQKILLVSKIPLDPEAKEAKEIALICEILVRKGYVVRRNCEITQCEVCKKALIPKTLYDELPRDKIKNLPDSWSNKCKNC